MGGTAAGTPWRLQVQAGPRPRNGCPIDVPAAERMADGPYVLTADEGPPVPAWCSGGRLLAVLPQLAAGETRSYTAEARPAGAWRPGGATAEVALTPADDGAAIEVAIGGAAFATLRLRAGPKPFLHPVRAPGGLSVVRGWPVAPREGDSTDHPHHRGAWVGHGDVNGADTWEERPGRAGSISVESVRATSGPGCAEVRCALSWRRADGEAVGTEDRLYRFWGCGGQAYLWDQESVFEGAGGGPLRFGDTKEGALCGVRVATGMEGSAGGRITTAEGARGEQEAWGSAAGWCDYSGEPAEGGAGGPTVGVAIFSHPANPAQPARWHVRDYGLMTCNPFALSHYFPRQGRRGDWEIPAGVPATFRFRVCVHRDGAEGAQVARRYGDWAFPPRSRWLPAGA